MAVAASQYNDSLEQSISARTKCSVNVSKLTDILLGTYYFLPVWCRENADILAFVCFLSCLLRPWPFAADDIHMLNICFNCLPTTDKHNPPDYIMQMSCKGNKIEFHIFLPSNASHSFVFMTLQKTCNPWREVSDSYSYCI